MIWILAAFSLLAIGLETVWDIQRAKAVVGSHERYVLATKRKIAFWAMIASFTITVAFCIMNAWYLAAAINMWTLINSINRERRRKDDDDWFNGRWKKIKAGAKKLVQSLAPSPAPSFSGAGA